jgi:hypothetical protein
MTKRIKRSDITAAIAQAKKLKLSGRSGVEILVIKSDYIDADQCGWIQALIRAQLSVDVRERVFVLVIPTNNDAFKISVGAS